MTLSNIRCASYEKRAQLREPYQYNEIWLFSKERVKNSTQQSLALIKKKNKKTKKQTKNL